MLIACLIPDGVARGVVSLLWFILGVKQLFSAEKKKKIKPYLFLC